MDIKIYVASIDNIDLSRAAELSPKRAEKVERLKKIEDKKRCVAGGLLIKKFLPDSDIIYNKFGKPIDKNGCCFNLSHSGNYVLLAVSDFEIGCDIQEVKYSNTEKIGSYVFCNTEITFLKNSSDKLGAFYDLWTKKESFLKCIGEGFHRLAKSVDVSGDVYTENGNSYYFKTYRFSDYVISACSTSDSFPKIIEFTNL